MTTAPLAPSPSSTDRLVYAAGEAAATALPASQVLTADAVQAGEPRIADLFAAAVIADLAGGLQGRVAVLVAEDLVRAIAESPIEGLDLNAAVQPALDAARPPPAGRA